jgi:transposase InsO family protein
LVEEVTLEASEPARVFVAVWQTPEAEVQERVADRDRVGEPECLGLGEACRKDEHLKLVREVIDVAVAEQTAPRRRGPAGQRRKRQLERDVRHETVDLYRWLKERGGTYAEAADLLDIAPRTLRQWEHDSRCANLEVVPRGRPTTRSTVEERQAVLDRVHEADYRVGVPTLHTTFPTLGRNELAEMMARRRQVVHDRYHEAVHVLHWQQPGRVWAIDFAEPSLLGASGSLPPVDGRYPYVLAVRDLASGYQLAWLPIAETTAEATQDALAHLFAVHGAPLVLKMDNGSAFRAEALQDFLRKKSVIELYSPPHRPSYNGSIEAAIGSLKRRTEQQASGAGHPGVWTNADLATALEKANQSQPRRLHGGTPAEAWDARSAIRGVEHACFALAVERERLTARCELKIAHTEELDHWLGAVVDRLAISRALVGRGYLLFRRRCIPLTINNAKVANIR